MKRIIIFTFVFALLCPLMRAQADGFVIRGRIAGMADGVSVSLLTGENHPTETLAETTVKKGRFELRGKVGNPTVCTLITNNLSLVSEGKQSDIRWTYTPVFVDNVRMTVETSHYDSIPLDAAVSPSFRITGGEIQRDFTEWHLLSGNGMYSLEHAWDFIASHPRSAVSAWLGNRLMQQGYNLTIDEVECLERAVEAVPADPTRFAAFRQNCAYARQTAKYRPLVDLVLNDTEGRLCRLAEVVPMGKIVIVDFWATWCAPCMMAIEPIKELAERYPERLAVVGVSCDENLKAWKAAIEKKQARWPQYVLPKASYEEMLKKYQIGGFPYFLILDEQGRVIDNPKGVEAIRKTVEELCEGEGFVFRGEVGVVPDTLYVTLVNKEQEGDPVLACDTLTAGGTFRLTGRVASPVMGELRMLVKDARTGLAPLATAQVFIDNKAYAVRFSAPDTSAATEGETSGMRVSGGMVQRQLDAFREYLAPYEQEAAARGMEAFYAWIGGLAGDTLQMIKETQRAAEQRLDSATLDFVRQHPRDAVSAWWMQQKLNTYFRYTLPEQEAFLAMLDGNIDTARVSRLRRMVQLRARYARLTPYTDFQAATPSGDMQAISKLREPGKYMLIDFWASWCGPCRQAIPRVKELYSQYAPHLQVVSVSADQKEADWHKAMQEENMVWTQLRLVAQGGQDAVVGYGLSTIPYLVLIAPDGRVLCATNDPEEVAGRLKEALGVQAQEGVRFFEGTLEEALQEARAQKKMLFIDAYTSWCGPCKWMSESEFKKPEAGVFFNKHFVNYKIDVEKGEGLAFAKKYDVRGYPTFLILNADGTLRHRILGADTLHIFIPMVEQGLQESTSYAYLRRKYDRGKLTKQELPQAIRTFHTAGMKQEVKALCESLYSLLSDEEKLSEHYWVVFEQLSYNDLYSERLDFLITHTDKLGDGRRQEDARRIFRTQLSDHLINNTIGYITHKHNPWKLDEADEMPRLRVLVGKSDLPDKAFWLAWCDLATACYYERVEEVPACVEKIAALPEAREYGHYFIGTLKRLCPEQEKSIDRLQEMWGMKE